MKFKVALKDLQQAINKTLPAVPRKSTLPVLEHLSLTVKDSELKMIATDQDLTIMTTLTVESPESGGILAPGRKLNDIVRALGTEGDLEFDSNDDTLEITLITANGRYGMKGLRREEFIDLPELFESDKPNLEEALNKDNLIPGKSPTAVFKEDSMVWIAEKTAFAVSKDEYRPAMTGVYFEFAGDKVTAVATDSFRLAKAVLRSDESAFPSDLNMIIPARAVDLLAKADSDTIVSVIKSGAKVTHARFDIGSTAVISRIIDEEYPPYESVIPTNNDYTAIVEKTSLLAAIKRVAIFASSVSNQIKLTVHNSSIKIKGEDEEGGTKADEEIKCDFDGHPMEVGFNYKFLEEALQNVDPDEDERVAICFSEADKPALVKPGADNEDYLVLIMPVRLSR